MTEKKPLREEASLRKLVLYHYRRSQSGAVESDTIEFSAILEKNGKRVRVGKHYTEGTDHKPRDIFKLLETGWKLVLVESCYKWNWKSRRYVGEAAKLRDPQDCYGRYFVEDLWCGWYGKVDLIGKRRFEEKLFHNADTGKEIVKFGVSEEVRHLIDEVEWMIEKVLS